MVVQLIDWNLRYFGVKEGSSSNTCFHTFSFLLTKHLEPRPSSAKLLLPIITIGIVACAFVLLWDNLCWNSCITWMGSLVDSFWDRGKGQLSNGQFDHMMNSAWLLHELNRISGDCLFASNVVIDSAYASSQPIFPVEASSKEITSYHSNKMFFLKKCRERAQNTLAFHSTEIPLQ